MSNPMNQSYSSENIDYWLDKEPYDVLAANVSNARKAAEFEAGIGINLNDPIYDSSGDELVFDTDPPLTFSQVSTNLAHHTMAILHLVVIGYHYGQPEEQRYWDTSEDFNFEIIINDDFDAPLYGQEHRHIPPVSMLYAVSKAFVEHAEAADFYFKLLEEPQAKKRVYFNIYNKNRPLSLFEGGLIDHNHLFKLIGQTGINYVNAKRKEIED